MGSGVPRATLLGALVLAAGCRPLETVGPLGDGRVVLPVNRVLSPAGAQVDLPGVRPQVIALSPSGKTLVTSGKTGEVVALDPSTGGVRRLFDVGVAPYDVVLVRAKAYVSNWGGRRPTPHSVTGPAGRGTVVRVDPVRYIASEGSVSVIDLRSGEVACERDRRAD